HAATYFDSSCGGKIAAPEAQKCAPEALAKESPWQKAEADGTYENVFHAMAPLTEAVGPAARARGYGTDDAGAGQNVVIDFSSPNIARPLAFHHIRSTVIGAAVGRLHAARGWNVVGINYIGDWGKQFGLLATGFQRFGDPARRADAKHLVEVYVRANKEADVEGLRAKMRAPEEARAAAAELTAARAALATADPKTKKKAEARVKSLEKRVPAGAAFDAHLAELEQKAKDAAAALPEA